jgi:hypothetical protein
MAQKKNPCSAGTLRGTGKDTPAVSGAAYPQKTQPDDALWDACREAGDAEASRKKQEAAREKSAALKLGFANESGRWAAQCPSCGCEVHLFTPSNGQVRAYGSKATCAAVAEIQIRLREWGFQ